ncbi:ribosomal RNA large subunit methyltransferase J [Aureimonas sp. SA4125]|uniref:23S rRNA (adenine(2030)-N(6))-methyltransferase RlmJ n=1 Tax=Aureimonas sp. SA4125 TaxID=2826993 RepID=UPI001CC547F6|nr:23S rRNA (adenine(2030)-N(6))-methyltransferase RlmJ [Aureimonas sp. SA4125]BDA83793.1 ribosomal RNA large subunit methyltransferase J [Aureimonas sp. SA4125]
MNYRHAFHAGNFADVVKHVLLVMIVEHLKAKDKAFRVYDTHAGRGRYDLGAEEARRTGEAAEGILQLLGSPAALAPELQTYLSIVTAEGKAVYPGSPLIVRRLLRKQDRLSAYELHPEDAKALAALFAGDIKVKTIALDGWLALGAHLPPKEKRGLVLIDPPFEQADEDDRIVEGVTAAHRRWAGGTYAIWYPIKRRAERARLHAGLKASGIPKILAAEFFREPFAAEDRLVGSGLVVINPPFTFAADAARVMAILKQVLAKAGQGSAEIVAISGERP